MKLTFVLTYWKGDRDIHAKCVESLTKAYPTAQIKVLCDTDRLKTGKNAGRWTKRWMERALKTGADIIIKVDPDTRAQVPATSFPDFDIFGQISADNAYFPGSRGVMEGGAIGFKASAVKAILDSGKLLDERYESAPFVPEPPRFGTPKPRIILQDPIVHAVAMQLGLKEGPWPGLDLKMHWETGTHSKDALFIHPVKE